MGQERGARLVSDLALVGVAAFAMNAGLSAYGAIYNNFLVNDLHITAQALGGLESLREVPGFLTVAMAAVTVQFRESRLAAFSLLLMGLGLAAISGAHSWWYLVAAGMVWSIGFHLFNPLSNGLVLAAAERSQEGRALGWIGGIGAAGALAGMAMVFAVVGLLGLRGTFVPTGLVVLAGAVALLFMRDKQVAPRTRLVVRRRYGIYYALTLLDGSRRQIFTTFAVFLLIKVYHLDVQHITALLIFNSIVTTLATPVIGRLIDRYGERRLLALNYACLIFLFAGYALVHNLIVLGVLYCLDNAFFAFSLGINSYLGRIAPPEDVTPSLVMGSTVNHIAAVGVPVVGGLLWSTVGYQVTFLAGAATCLLSVVSALAIRIERAPSPQRITCERPGGPPIAAMGAADGHAEGPAGPSPALGGREKQQVHERCLLGE
ncbi:MAG TPA: MFS transporter [Chloroflexota bacterium]|nr:MFS transporter [Chloroflexota bacterium]